MRNHIQLADAYYRLSDEERKYGESASITNQRTIVREYCEKHGIILVEEFADDGYSGGNFERPGFQAMLNHLAAGKANTVITKDLSRLGRDMTESSHYAERYFPEHGIRYLAPGSNFDSEDDNLMAPFQFAMNDVYLRDTSRKVKQTLNTKRNNGKYVACPPYGYRKAERTTDQLVPDENTAPVVKMIFDMAASGQSCRSIALRLNEACVMPPLKYRVECRDNFTERGAQRMSDLWNYTTVKRILRNRVYLGHTLLGKSRKVSVKSKKKVIVPEEEWVFTKDTHQALVTQEQFDLAAFTTFYDNAAAAVATAKAETDGDCRIEKNFLHTLNDPFLLGYWGISHYSSTKASTAKELLEQLGYVGYSTYGWGSTGVADSLLGIRWLYSDGSRPVAGHWQPVDCDSAYTLYKNDAAFPLAYLARQDALSVDVDALADNTFTMQNAMLQSLTGCTDTALVSVEPTFSVTDKGTVQVDFTAPLTGPAYMAIPGTEEQLPIDVVVDGKLYAQYFEPESLGGVICLPSFTAGQHVTMVLGIADDEVFHTNTQIYQLDSAALAAARQQVQDVDADIREGGRIDVHCTVSGDNDLLALSFAYDDNWVVTVNGEEVQPSALFGGLLGVSLPQGDCTVTLRYTHPGVVPGAAASLAALAAALGWMAWERKKKIGKPQT